MRLVIPVHVLTVPVLGLQLLPDPAGLVSLGHPVDFFYFMNCGFSTANVQQISYT